MDKTNLLSRILLALAVIVIVGWFLAGAPIPGRYQIAKGDDHLILLDTITGKIRLFGYRKVGTSHGREVQSAVEVFEMTK